MAKKKSAKVEDHDDEDEVAAPKKRKPRLPKRVKVRHTSPVTIAKRVRRRQATRKAAVSNPSGGETWKETAEFIAGSFAGYAVTRFASRVARVQLETKYPKAAPHLAVGSTVVTALAAWFLADKIKRFEKYHLPLVVGSSVAALQSIVQTYLPKFGWIVSDYQAPVAALPPTPTAGYFEKSKSRVDDFSDILSPDEHVGVMSVPSDGDEGDLDEFADDDLN